MKKVSKPVVITLVSILTIIFVVVIYLKTHNSTNRASVTGSNTKAGTGTQYSGPTDAENKETQALKDKIANESQPSTVPNGTKRTVTPVITSASATEVRSYVPGVAEDNGTCTATYTKDSNTFKKSSIGFINASSTTCTVIETMRSEFSIPGTWSVSISYTSATVQGVSNTTTLEVK